jgi:large subunit ribosomal protein L36e
VITFQGTFRGNALQDREEKWFEAVRNSIDCNSVKGADCILDLRQGLNKGYPTTAIPKAAKPSHRKGVTSTKTKFVRSVIREVAGFSAYERRVLELLRNSKVSNRLLSKTV